MLASSQTSRGSKIAPRAPLRHLTRLSLTHTHSLPLSLTYTLSLFLAHTLTLSHTLSHSLAEHEHCTPCCQSTTIPNPNPNPNPNRKEHCTPCCQSTTIDGGLAAREGRALHPMLPVHYDRCRKPTWDRHRLRCFEIIYDGNGKRSRLPRGMPLVTRMFASANMRGIQWHP